MAALWTEACLTFPSLDAMREGYETYPVTRAVRRDVTRGAPGRAGPHRPPAANRPAWSRWVVSYSGSGPPGNRGRLHADPVRRGPAAGRGERRARRQRSPRGPMRPAAYVAAAESLRQPVGLPVRPDLRRLGRNARSAQAPRRCSGWISCLRAASCRCGSCGSSSSPSRIARVPVRDRPCAAACSYAASPIRERSSASML